MANELSALTEVAAEAIDRYAITPAEMFHKGVAARAFTRVGVAAAPAQLVHDRLARASYAGTRLGFALAATAARAAFERAGAGRDVRPLSASRGGRMLIEAVNALAGDRLAATHNTLAISMAVRQGGSDVECSPPALASAFPRASACLVVFAHGLAESEEWWARPPGRRISRRSFGPRLRADTGCTPVHVRYNTGLHVSQNGTALSELLEQLLSGWPVAVRRMVLVGHSMGGLVIRAACHSGSVMQRAWPALTSDVITLGTPHHGAPLAKAAHAASRALRALPETAPVAYVLDTRSAGIRDLRLGVLHEDDWRAGEPDVSGDRRRDIPLLAGCSHTFISATVTRDPRHPLGVMLGDLLVRTESAEGRCAERTLPLPAGAVRRLGGLTHFDLLDHPLVYGVLRDVVLNRSGRPSARGGRTVSG